MTHEKRDRKIKLAQERAIRLEKEIKKIGEHFSRDSFDSEYKKIETLILSSTYIPNEKKEELHGRLREQYQKVSLSEAKLTNNKSELSNAKNRLYELNKGDPDFDIKFARITLLIDRLSTERKTLVTQNVEANKELVKIRDDTSQLESKVELSPMPGPTPSLQPQATSDVDDYDSDKEEFLEEINELKADLEQLKTQANSETDQIVVQKRIDQLQKMYDSAPAAIVTPATEHLNSPEQALPTLRSATNQTEIALSPPGPTPTQREPTLSPTNLPNGIPYGCAEVVNKVHLKLIVDHYKKEYPDRTVNEQNKTLEFKSKDEGESFFAKQAQERPPRTFNFAKLDASGKPTDQNLFSCGDGKMYKGTFKQIENQLKAAEMSDSNNPNIKSGLAEIKKFTNPEPAARYASAAAPTEEPTPSATRRSP